MQLHVLLQLCNSLPPVTRFGLGSHTCLKLQHTQFSWGLTIRSCPPFRLLSLDSNHPSSASITLPRSNIFQNGCPSPKQPTPQTASLETACLLGCSFGGFFCLTFFFHSLFFRFFVTYRPWFRFFLTKLRNAVLCFPPSFLNTRPRAKQRSRLSHFHTLLHDPTVL